MQLEVNLLQQAMQAAVIPAKYFIIATNYIKGADFKNTISLLQQAMQAAGIQAKIFILAFYDNLGADFNNAICSMQHSINIDVNDIF